MRGAWIEILLTVREETADSASLLMRGAWIEMSYKYDKS